MCQHTSPLSNSHNITIQRCINNAHQKGQLWSTLTILRADGHVVHGLWWWVSKTHSQLPLSLGNTSWSSSLCSACVYGGWESRGRRRGGAKTIITLGRAKRGGGRSPNTIITLGGGGGGVGSVIRWRGRGGLKLPQRWGGGLKTTITTPPNSHYVEGCVTPCTRLYKRVNWPQNCCGLYVPIRIRGKWLRFVTHLRALPTQWPTNGGAGTNQKPWVVWSHEFCQGTGTSSLVLFGQL